jgi:glycosyltransferase involved in cell wall biosynthesis
MIKVSVLMPTYNHAPYIAEAIESFLAQETSFDIELLINDDCSTDTTVAIAQKYACQDGRVKVFQQSTNQGLLRNYQFLLEQAQGEYLAVLESDDYWIDAQKLQKQVDYLDAHPTCHLSFSGVLHLKRGQFVPNIDAAYLFNTPGKTPFDHILYRNIIFSPTVCFRRSAFDKYCSVQDYIDLGFKTFDYPVWLSLLTHGDVHYLPENTAVYRVSGTSISNNKNLKKKIDFAKSVNFDIKHYIIQKYGSGCFSAFDVRLRQAVVLSRCAWQLAMPLHAAFYFFGTLLGIVHGKK